MLRTDLPEIITETLPGPKAQAIIDRREAVNPSAIKCVYPVVIEKGEGAMIQDVDGNKFLDWIGGVGVLNIGFFTAGSCRSSQSTGREIFPRNVQCSDS